MSKTKRKSLFVDSTVQTGIIWRLVIYSFAGTLFIVLSLAFAKTFAEPERLFIDHVVNVCRQHWPVFLAGMALLPFAIYDVIKFSNRFVGPIYRIRQELKSFSAGKELRKITFREKDFWTDLSDGLNGLTERIQELEQKMAEDSRQV